MTARNGVGALLAAGLVWACGGGATSQTGTGSPGMPPGQSFAPDAGPSTPTGPGTPDAGTPAGPGTPDGGHPDAGVPGGGAPDAGAPDAGAPDGGPVSSPAPSAAGWQFFGVQNGGPTRVYGVTADEGGNLWVAGGSQGIFLLTPEEQAKGAAAHFKQFTIADGLHPWGYMQDGSDAPHDDSVEAISVSGGPAGTVFVGYAAKGSTVGNNPWVVEDDPCESEWDSNPNPDPSIYKSGDADRVELQPNGTIAVVHYDIFTGPGEVSNETQGREKVCTIYRIRYVKETNTVWFGGNHGVAAGNPTFPGAHATNCFGGNYGKFACNGLVEHIHPGLSCYQSDSSPKPGLCTYRYYGLSQGTDGMWIGGWQRSVHYDFGNTAASQPGPPNFFTYMDHQFDPSWWVDVWPDAATNDVHPSQETIDAISGVAAMKDGSAWFSSLGGLGLAHVKADGSREFISTGLLDNHLTAIASDPSDGSIWAGGWYGLDRVSNGQITTYGPQVFGRSLASGFVTDIQSEGDGAGRKMLVGFHPTDGSGDAVGIYSGQ